MSFIRLDKVPSSAHYETIEVGVDKDYYDGQFFNLGVSLDLDGEVVEAKEAKEGQRAIGLLCSVNIDYTSNTDMLVSSKLTKGDIGRVLILQKGNIISFSRQIAKGLKVGEKVTVAENGYGLKKASDNDYVVGQVIRLDHMTNIGELIVVRILLEEPSRNVTPEKGEQGERGKQGEQGKSAYQTWLDNGGKGSEQDFLISLKGNQGEQGRVGKQGKSAYQTWLDNGGDGSEQDFLKSLEGKQGRAGAKGKDAPTITKATLKLSEDETTIQGLTLTLSDESMIEAEIIK